MNDEHVLGEQTLAVERCLEKLRSCTQVGAADSQAVRNKLLEMTYLRMLRLTRKMKRDFGGLSRWEQTEDVLQNASVRLCDALAAVRIEDARHYFRLAALQIRRELIDLCRRHRGPQGLAANHATQPAQHGNESQLQAFQPCDPTHTTSDLQFWTDFHESVQALPPKEREVFELLWYHEVKQQEAAELMGISTRHLKRLWRSARLMLHDRLGDSGRRCYGF